MSLPSHGRREKTIALFVSDLCPSFHWRVGHDWNCINLLWRIVHVPSIEKHSLTFISPQALFPFWLSVTDPRSTPSFRILKFQFLIIWSLWSFAAVFDCWWFSGPLFRATSWSNKAITIWSWTEFSNFWLVLSLQDRRWRHFAYCWKCMNPSYIEILDMIILQTHSETNLRVLVLLQRLRLHGKTQKSFTQLVFLVRIGRNSQLLLFDTFSYSEVWLRAEMLLQGWRNHRMKQIEIRKIRLPL